MYEGPDRGRVPLELAVHKNATMLSPVVSMRGNGVSETLPRNKNGLGKVLVDDAADIKSANR